ncbi:MAG: prephenate dehydrogenase [Candidatus Hydrogenedentota bacterium]
MKPWFDTVAIVGAGLLGGSLGLALKQRGLARRIHGAGHRQTSLDAALERKAIDAAFLDARESVEGANLVVICTPAAMVKDKLDEIAPACPPEAVITDVASTKADICAHAAKRWDTDRRFVGSHPMAGSEKFGAEHADPELYEGRVAVVERGEGLDPEAQRAVCALWEAVGSRVVELEPSVHDALVARTSHLPHIAAAALAVVAGRAGSESKPLIGPGFRDTTRIAGGRPEIWRDICLTNGPAIEEALAELEPLLAAVRAAVRDKDEEALMAFFDEGRRMRRELADE